MTEKQNAEQSWTLDGFMEKAREIQKDLDEHKKEVELAQIEIKKGWEANDHT